MNGKRLGEWHSDPWDQRVLVLSGMGVYHHKIGQTPQPEIHVGGAGEPLAVFVAANTEYYWEADLGQVLRLFIVPKTDHPIRSLEVRPGT